MKTIYYYLLISLALSLSSCAAVEGIFKAGVWTGILLVALVLGIIMYLITRGSSKS